MKLTKQRLMEMAGLICEAADYTFSGTDKFMDQVAVNVFKKHGIDQSQLNREYDANEGIVEFTVNLDDALVDKISQELEGADRGKGEYGGMMEGSESINEARSNIMTSWKTGADVSDTVMADMEDFLEMIYKEGNYDTMDDLKFTLRSLSDLADNYLKNMK